MKFFGTQRVLRNPILNLFILQVEKILLKASILLRLFKSRFSLKEGNIPLPPAREDIGGRLYLLTILLFRCQER